jgi:ribosomal protein S18 acetylase RimI-like enzyme
VPRPAPSRQRPSIRKVSGDEFSDAVPLLYDSSGGMYDRFAGSRAGAERTLSRALGRQGNTASADVVWVAELDGRVAGVMAAMPYDQWTPRAYRFLRVTLRSISPWRWPRALWLYRASGRLTPEPPQSCFYVDSLATATEFRRRGVATALLEEAEAKALALGLRSVALDTWVHNKPARALYLAAGFEEVAYSPAVGDLPGGVSLMKELPGSSAARR